MVIKRHREENHSDIQYGKAPVSVRMAWTIPFFNKVVLSPFFVLSQMLCAGHRKMVQQ